MIEQSNDGNENPRKGHENNQQTECRILYTRRREAFKKRDLKKKQNKTQRAY